MTGPILGIDVGASKIEYGRFAPSRAKQGGGTLSDVLRIGTDRTLDDEGLAELLEGLAKGAGCARVGIGVPGYVREGRVGRLPNLPRVKPMNLRAILSRRLRVPLFLENDVKCMALGLWDARGRKEEDAFLVVAPGSGIGGAIVMDGKLVRGAHNTAGEFGHIEVEGGEWENLAGGWGIEKIYFEKTNRHERASRIFGRPEPAARAVSAQAARGLGTGLADLANAIDPPLIIMAGGLADAYLGRLRSPMRDAFCAQAIAPVQKTPIVRSPIAKPALIGAALLSLQDKDGQIKRFLGV